MSLTYDVEYQRRARRLYLKIKIKSLMAEAKMIKRAEEKHPAFINELHRHRVIEVRRESRAAHLVYAMIRGRARHTVEPNRRPFPGEVYSLGEIYNSERQDLRARFLRMAKRFGYGIQQEEALYWYNGVRDDPKVPRVTGDTAPDTSLIDADGPDIPYDCTLVPGQVTAPEFDVPNPADGEGSDAD